MIAKKQNKDRETQIKEIVTDAKTRNDFRGSIKTTPEYRKPSFTGKIINLKDIRITYNPEYKEKNKEDFEHTIDAVVEHEIVHKQDGKGRGCPKKEDYDIEKVLIPMSKVLKNNGIPNVPFGSQGHTVYSFFANMFQDFVVNNIGTENRGSEGFFALYDDMAEHTGLTELFEAFIKLQAMTFPEKKGVSRLLKHFKQPKKANETYKKYLERTNLMKLEKKERVKYLSNPENWPFLSEIFAEEYSKLLDLKELSKSWFPLFGGNDFQKLDDENVQMEIAIKAYKASHEEFIPPPFMDNNLALLAVYRQLAKEINIKVESTSVETRRPVTYVAKRKFDFEKDSLEKLTYGIDNKGKIKAQTGKHPLLVTSRYQVSAGHFPEVRIGLFDCSGSTQESINGKKGKVMNPWSSENKRWTDTSIYHQELKCAFGLWELFRRKGTLKKSNSRLGVFSNTTRLAKNLEESERMALQPEFRGTAIQESYLDEFFAGRNSLLYTISDGEVTNWPRIKDKFIERAKKHNYFHLQIGRETPMYLDLKEAGLTAILDDGTKADQILIDLTLKNVYGGKK